MKRIIYPLIFLYLFSTAYPATKAQPAKVAVDTLLTEGNAFASQGKLDAALWNYRQAADAGNIDGTFAAGQILLIQGQTSSGRERILKISEGLGYMYRAATNRYPQACAELANALQAGIGAQTNLINAYAWQYVAAQLDPMFRNGLDKLVVQLDSEEVLLAQNTAREYAIGHWPSPVARPVEEGDARLKIQGITSSPRGSLMILNGVSVAQGETIQVLPAGNFNQKNVGKKMTVSCLVLAQDHALISVLGENNLKLLTIKRN